ncbi:MAG: GNAT family N-acetyltransferase [Bacteroidota bacterium]|nr:GNAT family N-acetyltransferase [Bacteroidota bacterium]MDX5431440.1 GNAT family N-acetyltransferase [Bacteroidota bacterium]MDX5470168.1 GNAT family N-acetyltransferase [Bacteroidota bacterium]
MIIELSPNDIPRMLPLAGILNPRTEIMVLESRLRELFSYANYTCYGWEENGELLAMCGAWTMTKLYSGKQLEVDNFAVSLDHQSKGIGAKLMEAFEAKCREEGFQSIELNAYVKNAAGHKFYFRQGYSIVGFHFIKRLFD